MNELGREKLRKAALSGVKQTFHRYFTSRRTAFCALGVLFYWRERNESDACRKYGIKRGRSNTSQCTLCSFQDDELGLVLHLNDFHQLDFLKIAEIAP